MRFAGIDCAVCALAAEDKHTIKPTAARTNATNILQFMTIVTRRKAMKTLGVSIFANHKCNVLRNI
jgi:hypothetical protein